MINKPAYFCRCTVGSEKRHKPFCISDGACSKGVGAFYIRLAGTTDEKKASNKNQQADSRQQAISRKRGISVSFRVFYAVCCIRHISYLFRLTSYCILPTF